MLHVENLQAGYGRHEVLFNISAAFKEREITVLVGPNGSGKSTLLKSIFGLTRIYGGTIHYDGENITGRSPHYVARHGIAYLPQVESVFGALSVKDNLQMARYTIRKEETAERMHGVLEMFPVLNGYLDRKARTLSGGERQMLAMAMALQRSPRLMLFDEPTGNLSPKLAKEVLGKIRELRDRLDITIVLVEQNAIRALELGDQAYLLVAGRLVFEGKPEALLTHADLSRLYLGIRQAESPPS
jgi:branched-chain amino acid transport system ATP-binding protein